MCDQAFNIKLVKEVEKYPVLYNYTLPGYSRKDVTEKAWSEVGEAVQTTGAECKEKWKNLRAVFVRHMKPAPSGSGSKHKKPYYLTEVMMFTLPYIKVLTATAGNLSLSNLSREDEDDQQSFSDTEESDYTALHSQQPHTPPPQPITEVWLPQQPDLPKTHSQPTPRPNKKRSLRNEFVDKALVEYLQDKKAEVTVTPDCSANPNPKSESFKMFLLSMLPDLESMSDGQVRKFKRKCLQSIDEILNEQTTAISSSSISVMNITKFDN